MLKSKYMTIILFTATLAVVIGSAAGLNVIKSNKNNSVSNSTPQSSVIVVTETNDVGQIIEVTTIVSSNSNSPSINDIINDMLSGNKPSDTVFGGGNVGGANSNLGGPKYELSGEAVTTVWDTETTKTDETTQAPIETIPVPPVTNPPTPIPETAPPVIPTPETTGIAETTDAETTEITPPETSPETDKETDDTSVDTTTEPDDGEIDNSQSEGAE